MPRLGIGDTLLIQCAHFEERHLAVLVGQECGRFLVVYADLPKATLKGLRKHPNVSVRYAHESTLLGFETRLMGKPSDPGQLLFLQYPESIQDCDQRCEKRLLCNFPARLQTRTEEFPCLIQDLSASAMRVSLPPDQTSGFLFQKNDPVRISFHVISPTARFTFQCRLLREFLAQGKRFAVLRLDEHETRNKALLQNWVQSAYDSPAPPCGG
ncbi:MAG: PilZ domain-containing protein [Desulfovibrio sp.]|nr:PilZ domain-containing protein [Desulfovibrio sp.]